MREINNSEKLRRKLVFFVPLITVIGFSVFIYFTYSINNQNSNRLHMIKEVYFPIFEISNSSAARLDRIAEYLSSGAASGEIDLIVKAQKQASELLDNIENLKTLEMDHTRKNDIDTFKNSFLSYYNLASKFSTEIVKNNIGITSKPEETIKISLALNNAKKILNDFRLYSHKNFHQTISNANQANALELRLGAITGIITVLIILFGTFSLTNILRQ